MELPPSAAEHPVGRGARRDAGRGRPLRRGVPRRATAAHRGAPPGAAAGRAPDRRGRPGRRRLRGLPARAAGRARRDHPGARHDPGHPPADRGAHVQPHPRAARRVQAPLPLPLDRLPVGPSAARRSSAAGCRAAPASSREQVAETVARLRRPRPAEASGHRRGDRLGRRAGAARRPRRRRRRGRPHAGLGAEVRRGPAAGPRAAASPAWSPGEHRAGPSSRPRQPGGAVRSRAAPSGRAGLVSRDRPAGKGSRAVPADDRRTSSTGARGSACSGRSTPWRRSTPSSPSSSAGSVDVADHRGQSAPASPEPAAAPWSQPESTARPAPPGWRRSSAASGDHGAATTRALRAIASSEERLTEQTSAS